MSVRILCSMTVMRPMDCALIPMDPISVAVIQDTVGMESLQDTVGMESFALVSEPNKLQCVSKCHDTLCMPY